MPSNRPEPGADLIDGPGRRRAAGGDRDRPPRRDRAARGAARPAPSRRARVMGGAWVFPGGSVDPADGVGQAGTSKPPQSASCARRSGSRWMPAPSWCRSCAGSRPSGGNHRFDTWFFLTYEPAGAAPRIDGSEIVDFRWTARRRRSAPPPAASSCSSFRRSSNSSDWARFASAEELLTHARGTTVTAIQPRIVGTGEHARILLPGDRGYED